MRYKNLKEELEAVRQHGYNIQYIDYPSEEIQLEAVKQNGWCIQHIINPSLEVQIEAVKQNSSVIGQVNNPQEAVQLQAVKQNGWSIEYIKNPSEAVKLEAVKQNGRCIRSIRNPSLEVQLQAVKKNGWSIEYIKNPSEALLKKYLLYVFKIKRTKMNLPEIINTFNLKYKFRNIRQGVKNFWIYRNIIWNDRWWDSGFLHDIIRFKLNLMAENWHKSMYVDSNIELLKLKELVAMLDEIKSLDDFTNAGDIDALYQKFGRSLFDINKYDMKIDGKIYTKECSGIRKFWD